MNTSDQGGMDRIEGYVVANGVRMFFVSQGEGPLVLLLHGFPESWYSWRHQLQPLAAAGFRAVAVDLPGYGRSDKPDVTYDLLWLNACIAGVIPSLGHDTAVVVGHDWGGLLAWPFARMYPERTAGIIGLNTPDLPRTPVPPTEYVRSTGSARHAYILAFQERGAAEAAVEADVEAFLRLFFLGPATVRKEAFTDQVIAEYVKDFKPKGAITPPLEYYRNLDRNWELSEEIAHAKIEAPCLMVMAEGDPVLTPALADGMEQRVLNVDKVLIRDCGHWTQQEQPDQTTEHMLRFLRSLPRWP